MDSFPETYNDPISFMGALMGYLSYGNFLVCVTRAKTAPRDITFLIFTNCSPFFPPAFSHSAFSPRVSWKLKKRTVIYC